MILHRIGPNATEIEDGNRSVLFSYSMPVAVHVEGMGYYVTAKYHSRATSRHIKEFCGEWHAGARRVPPEVIARMAAGGTIAAPADVE